MTAIVVPKYTLKTCPEEKQLSRLDATDLNLMLAFAKCIILHADGYQPLALTNCSRQVTQF
jgi:hypothetical protein